jgi:hypothetical protein
MFTAYDMAIELDGGRSGYNFGVAPKRAAAELRKLADKIECGDINLQKVLQTSLAALEDFTVTRVSLTFHERQNKIVIRHSDTCYSLRGGSCDCDFGKRLAETIGVPYGEASA